MMGSLRIQILLVIITLYSTIEASSENTEWKSICQNRKGQMLISNNDTSIFKIKEGHKWKILMTDYDEEMVKCTSSRDNLKDENGNEITSVRAKTLKMDRPNAFNGEVKVACEDSFGQFCTTTITVLWRKLQKECKINNILSCDINHIETERKMFRFSKKNTSPEKSTQRPTTVPTEPAFEPPFEPPLGRTTPSAPFDPFIITHRWFGGDKEDSEESYSKPNKGEDMRIFQHEKIETTTIISVTSPSLSSSEAVKYSIYVNEKVI